MLDPTRYALNAETVGFRKRTLQTVDWGAFNQALQTQTDSIKVRRELEETPVTELHVMGGQRFGLEGNVKTNELARQHRQMNGYVLRSFLATGGPVILPPKKNDSVIGLPSKFGQVQYTPNAVQGQQYVSSFTEPLNAPLENNTILLGRQGIQAKSNSISDPYKALQFQMGMEASQAQIKAVADAHAERKSANAQEDLARQSEILAAPKHLRPTISLVDQIARQKNIPQKRTKTSARTNLADILGGTYKGRPAETVPSEETTTSRREPSTTIGMQLKPLNLGQKTKDFKQAKARIGSTESENVDKYKDKLKQVRAEEKASRELEAGEAAGVRFNEKYQNYSEAKARNQEENQEYEDLFRITNKPFEHESEEYAAMIFSNKYKISMEEARTYLLMDSFDYEEAERSYAAVNSAQRFKGAAHVERSVQELNLLERVNASADNSLFSGNSSTNFNSSIEEFIATSMPSPMVQLKSTAVGIGYNDVALPTSEPSAGFLTPGQSPFSFGSGSQGSTKKAPYMGGLVSSDSSSLQLNFKESPVKKSYVPGARKSLKQGSAATSIQTQIAISSKTNYLTAQSVKDIGAGGKKYDNPYYARKTYLTGNEYTYL